MEEVLIIDCTALQCHHQNRIHRPVLHLSLPLNRYRSQCDGCEIPASKALISRSNEGSRGLSIHQRYEQKLGFGMLAWRMERTAITEEISLVEMTELLSVSHTSRSFQVHIWKRRQPCLDYNKTERFSSLSRTRPMLVYKIGPLDIRTHQNLAKVAIWHLSRNSSCGNLSIISSSTPCAQCSLVEPVQFPNLPEFINLGANGGIRVSFGPCGFPRRLTTGRR